MPTERELPHGGPVKALEYAAILQFYAEQMHYLDALDIDAYAATFTRAGTIEHRDAGHEQSGREQIVAHANAVLETYKVSGPRHWNGGYFVQRTSTPGAEARYEVRYASLVTYRRQEAPVAFKEPFEVVDTLALEDGALRVQRRVIEQP